MKLKHLFVVLFLSALVTLPAMALDTTTLDPGTATDWNVWALSGVLGLVLFLLSLRATASTAEVELDAILSVMAWVPIAFCSYTSFAVSRVTSTGYVTVYSHWIIGVLMFVFGIAAVLNTVRIIALHKVLRGEQQGSQVRDY